MISLNTPKTAEQAKMRKDKEAFLKAGGVIQVLGVTVTAYRATHESDQSARRGKQLSRRGPGITINGARRKS